jgi:hypothetical protein
MSLDKLEYNPWTVGQPPQQPPPQQPPPAGAPEGTAAVPGVLARPPTLTADQTRDTSACPRGQVTPSAPSVTLRRTSKVVSQVRQR